MPKPKFNPNKPFEAVSEGKKPKFNPNKSFEVATDPDQPSESGWPTLSGIIQGTKENLPMLGGMAGGLIGGVVSGIPTLGMGAPGGAAVGAGFGSAIGKVGQNLWKTLEGDADTPQGLVEPTLGVAREGLMGAASEGLGGALAKGGSKVMGAAAKGAKKVVGELSNFSEKAVDTYMKRAGDVDKIIKKYGAEGIENAVPEFKREIVETVNSARAQASRQVGEALKGDAGTRIANVDSVKKYLGEQLGNINQTTHPSDYAQVTDLLGRLSKMSDEGGNILTKDLHDYKSMLQDIAKGTYQKDGQITFSGKMAQKVANVTAKKARTLFNEAAPEVASLNNKLHKIYQIERTLPRSVLAENMSPARLSQIAAGNAPGQAKALQELGNVVGRPGIMTEAENIYTAQKMANPNMLSNWQTGRSLLPYALGGAAGGIYNDEDRFAGALGGAALGSPMVSKQLIKGAGLLGKGLTSAMPGLGGELMKQGGRSGARGLLENSGDIIRMGGRWFQKSGDKWVPVDEGAEQ